jgi:hypothetical protein
LVLGLVTNLVWALVLFAGARIALRDRLVSPRFRRWWFLGTIALEVIVLGASLAIISWFNMSRYLGWILVILGSAWAVATCLRELNRFWRVGLIGADDEVRHGISYAQSLTLVTSEFSFLGTGASKLSILPEFQAAMRKCRDDVPIRLLLRKPDDPTLTDAAQRAGTAADAYSDKVVESLRTIANLQRSIKNIEVRFYEGDKIFRIALIDRQICLVSFNIYGIGDGSELPQVHLTRAPERHEVHRSFFHAYERYFNEHWLAAQPWDPEVYRG